MNFEVPVNHRSGLVALVGPANAGKSTLLNALLGKKVSIVTPRAHTTRNRVLGIRDSELSQIVFVDTPGFVPKGTGRELGKFLVSALHEGADGVDLCVLVIDAQKLVGRESQLDGVVELYDQQRLSHPAIIVVNKVDLVDKLKILPLIKKLADCFPGVEIIPLSALTEDGIELLEKSVLEQLPQGPPYFEKGALTDQTEEFFAAELIREKLYLNLRDEIPYSIAVRIEDWVEEKGLIRIKGLIYVERDSQKGIVIGKGGEMLKTVGSSARKELEKILGTRIFLELFVRVEPKWTTSPKGLRKVGYGS